VELQFNIHINTKITILYGHKFHVWKLITSTVNNEKRGGPVSARPTSAPKLNEPILDCITIGIMMHHSNLAPKNFALLTFTMPGAETPPLYFQQLVHFRRRSWTCWYWTWTPQRKIGLNLRRLTQVTMTFGRPKNRLNLTKIVPCMGCKLSESKKMILAIWIELTQIYMHSESCVLKTFRLDPSKTI